MRLCFYWNYYRYFPYEQDLAVKEIYSLFGVQPVITSDTLQLEVDNDSEWQTRAERLTYFSKVVSSEGVTVVPLQTRLEATTSIKWQNTLPGVLEVPKLRKQSTRYSAHGIHEYRGKYNPQIVRAVGNALGLSKHAWLLDPFCGSGTTLLEAAHSHWNSMGVEINPLGVLISNAKVAAAHVDVSILRGASFQLIQRLSDVFSGFDFSEEFTPLQERQLLAQGDVFLLDTDYLMSWFVRSIIIQISVILSFISEIQDSDTRLVFRVILSDILRDVSLQDPGDLRIRRRKIILKNLPVVSMYISRLKSQIDFIERSRLVADFGGFQKAVLGDARVIEGVCKGDRPIDLFDAVITSPPYATALPYVDTQRLSLVLLGLINANDIRTTEKLLIGNREITPRERNLLNASIKENADRLPEMCISLCRDMLAALNSSSDGFRRQNMPALIYQYCRDMRLVFEGLCRLLRNNAPLVFIVGPNKTTLGDRDFIIETPKLLADLAASCGLTFQYGQLLESYHRFDVHQANSIRSESMLVFRRP